MLRRQCTGQFFIAGKLIDYNGPAAPEDFTLPEDMEIIPWEHPRFFWLTIKGTLVAGPARWEVLESFLHDLITNPERQEELAAMQMEVDEL